MATQIKAKRGPGNPNWYKGMPSVNPGGRPAARDAIGKEVVEALRDSFHELGGKDWLMDLARTDKRTFAALIGKVIPQDISATVTHTVIDLGKAMDEANARLAAAGGQPIDITPTTKEFEPPTIDNNETKEHSEKWS